jgi:LacI family transcriptional regulator
MATGVMRFAHQQNIEIPGELSVVGFDDIPIAAQAYPALTTIRQPMWKMAEKATELLLAQLRGHLPEPQIIVVDSSLQLRESTGPARTTSLELAVEN